MALTRSSSGGIAIRYVFPVLWMTSRLPVIVHIAYFNIGAESDVYECLVGVELSAGILRHVCVGSRTSVLNECAGQVLPPGKSH